MSRWSDDELGMGRAISRRDFLDGVAIGVGALALGGAAPAGALARGRKDPPARQGLRGQTDAAMRIPHALRDGTFRTSGARDTGERYDLVVVGGGISGLSAARFFQREFGRDARILILDALDDVGGHARRNEFRAHGRTLVGYGGSQSLESPSTFSRPAKRLLEDLDIEVDRFEKFFDSGFNAKHGLGRGLFFDAETWGRDHFVAYRGDTPYAEILRDAPMADRAKADLAKIYDAPEDWMAGHDRRPEEGPARRDHLPPVPDRPRQGASGRAEVPPDDAERELGLRRGRGRGARRLRRVRRLRRAGAGLGASRTAGSRPPGTSCGRPRTTTSTTSRRATRGWSGRSCAS